MSRLKSASEALLYSRILGGAWQSAQLWFDASVLEKYRAAGAKVLRTNTMGRLKLPQWSIDFGITGGAEQSDGNDPQVSSSRIHLSLADAQTRIPEGERSHWAGHVASLPLSTGFATVQLTRGACIDDGDLRDW